MCTPLHTGHVQVHSVHIHVRCAVSYESTMCVCECVCVCVCVRVYTSDCSGHLPGGHWKDGTADAAPRGWRPLYGSMRTAQVVVARVKLQGAVSGVPFPLPCADLRLHRVVRFSINPW